MSDTSKLRSRLFVLLDKIESLLTNLTKIQTEIFSVISELPPKRSQSEIEDILGIKVYLGSDYIERGGGGQFNYNFNGIKIGEELSDTELIVENLIEKDILPKSFDITVNTLTLEQLEDEYIHSTEELWK